MYIVIIVTLIHDDDDVHVHVRPVRYVTFNNIIFIILLNII